MKLLDDDRLVSTEEQSPCLAHALYEGARELPIIDPHAHTTHWFRTGPD
ncbi:hypothetical protein [Agrobacterium sp. NPDC089420]